MPDSTPSPVSIITAGGRTYKLPHRDAMPPLAADERQRLRDDIRRNGIKVPILVTEDDEVLDGHHRLSVAAELGLPAEQIPLKLDAGLPAEQKQRLAVSLNLHRRHLTREQVQQQIGEMLKADPEQSDRVIGIKANVDHKTVGRVRKKLTASGAVPQTDTVTGKDGRTRKRPTAGGSGTTPRKPSTSEPAAPVPSPSSAAEVLPDPPAPAPRRDAKWAELVGIAFYLKDTSAVVGRLAKCKVADRTAGPVRDQIQRLTAMMAQLEEAAASQEARTPPA